MSTFVATGESSGVAIEALDLTGFWIQSRAVFHTNNATVIGFSAGEFLFEGSGFGGFDKHGFATTGTITSLKIFVADVELEITDFSAAASDIQKMFRHGDSIKFARTIFGGDDTITLGDGGGSANGYWGDDTITGRGGDDRLFGYLGDDKLFGSDGDDRLQGDGGADTLKGGKGADSFEYKLLTDSKNNAPDTIVDLHANDTISLSAIDANTSTTDDDAFHIVGSAFGGNAGELILHFDSPNNRTVIQGDVDGDGHADFTIWASGKHVAFDNFGF